MTVKKSEGPPYSRGAWLLFHILSRINQIKNLHQSRSNEV
jgi:hypothetical protein